MKRPGTTVFWMGWLATLALATIVMWLLRDDLDKAHVALLYLVIVLGGSATGGRALGLSLSALAFFAFDGVFLPPYGTLAIRNPLDWLVLLSFLVTSFVATQLLDRARERAVAAQRRADEIERLSILGAETLNAGVATDALAAIAEVIRSTLGVDHCDILAHYSSGGSSASGATAETVTLLARAGAPAVAPGDDESKGLTTWVAEQGLPAVLRGDHTAQVGASGWEADSDPWLSQGDVRVLLIPLLARGRAVGVLRISHREQIVLRAEEREFLRALSYYAALGVERVRLVAAAERAEAFRQADALKTALIATVSHDLRTPLTTIKALAHRLATNGDADAHSIEEEADRLSRFVGDLLDLSRIAANAMPVRVEINAAEELVDAARQRLAGALQHRELCVLVAQGTPLLLGRFDLVQSVRVLVNLIENALKYSPASAPVELAVSRRGDRLVLEVRDRGPGVPAEEEKLIWEPFYRPVGTRPDVGGAGLGLAIARGLAEMQDGVVRYAPREGGRQRVHARATRRRNTGAERSLIASRALAARLDSLHEIFIPGRADFHTALMRVAIPSTRARSIGLPDGGFHVRPAVCHWHPRLFRAHARVHRGVREARRHRRAGGGRVTIETAVGAALAVCVLAYLVYTLLRPERF